MAQEIDFRLGSNSGEREHALDVIAHRIRIVTSGAQHIEELVKLGYLGYTPVAEYVAQAESVEPGTPTLEDGYDEA